MTMGLDEDL